MCSLGKKLLQSRPARAPFESTRISSWPRIISLWPGLWTATGKRYGLTDISATHLEEDQNEKMSDNRGRSVDLRHCVVADLRVVRPRKRNLGSAFGGGDELREPGGNDRRRRSFYFRRPRRSYI